MLDNRAVTLEEMEYLYEQRQEGLTRNQLNEHLRSLEPVGAVDHEDSTRRTARQGHTDWQEQAWQGASERRSDPEQYNRPVTYAEMGELYRQPNLTTTDDDLQRRWARLRVESWSTATGMVVRLQLLDNRPNNTLAKG